MTKKIKTDPLVEKIEALELELEQAQDQKEAAVQAQARALADLQNYQRRETQAKAGWSTEAVVVFLKGALPSFLELNLGAQNTQDETIKAVIEKFFTRLESGGLKKIEPQAQTPLDPNLHEVLMAAEGTPGTVVGCLEPGWMYLDKVIIPAKVSGASA